MDAQQEDPVPPGKGRPNPGARDLAASALAAGHTAVSAAVIAKVHERTVRKWLAEPDFRAAVERLRAGAVAAAMHRIGGAMVKAADVLEKLLESKDEHVRHKAAAKLIELGVRLKDHVELEQRLEALERVLKGRTG